MSRKTNLKKRLFSIYVELLSIIFMILMIKKKAPQKGTFKNIYNSVLPSKALDKVTSSAYSKSPPTGIP